MSRNVCKVLNVVVDKVERCVLYVVIGSICRRFPNSYFVEFFVFIFCILLLPGCELMYVPYFL